MIHIGKARMVSLRVFYFMVGSGFAFLALLDSLLGQIGIAAFETIIKSVLLAVSLLALIGIFQPLKMLPLLLLSIFWKTILLVLFIAPSYFIGTLDDGLKSILWPVFIGFLVTLIVIPWKYVISNFFTLKVGA